MHHVFFINPAAGKSDRTKEVTAEINRTLGNRLQDTYEIFVSQYPGHLTQLAEEFCKTGRPARLYACGGDGTLHEVVSGCVGHSHVAITTLSGGTGNDFIKIFSDPHAFTSLANLVDGAEFEMDIVSCNQRYSMNICSLGLDARIGAGVTAFKRLPLISGFGAYCLSALVNMFKGIHQPCEITVNGETITGNQTMVCVANGRWYGGGFFPVPEAEVDDGLLDVLIVAPVSRLTVAKVIGKFKNGNHKELPQYIRHIRCKELTVTSPTPTTVGMDGEAMTTDRVTFAIAPEKIRFFYPTGLTYHSQMAEKERISV